MADELALGDAIVAAMHEKHFPNGKATSVDTLTKAAVNLGTELGSSGLKHSYGLVQEEFLPQLQGDKAVKVYQEMETNDPTVGAVLYALQNIVRQVTWGTEGPNASFVDENMHGMSHSWEDFIAEAMSKLPYGWAYHEIVYREDDGRIMWGKLPIRAQSSFSRWEFDATGGTQGMWQSGPMWREVFLPIQKCLLFRTTHHKNNPEGRSVLRTAYRSWWFKKRIEEIEAVGIERDLAGIPKITVPAELLASNANSEVTAALDAFKKMGRDVRNNEQAFVLLPGAFDEHGNKLYDFELMSSSGRRQFVTDTVIQRHKLDIAQASLSDVILMGHERVGSFALSESKEALLSAGLQAQVDEIAAVLNGHALPRLFELNGIDDEGQTRIVPGEIEAVNLKDLAEIIWKLSMAGMALFPSDKLEARLRTMLDLPEAEGTELITNPNTGAKTAPGEGGDGGDPDETSDQASEE